MDNLVIPMDFQKEKNKPTYDQAIALDCPYEALMDRVILIQIENEDGTKKKKSTLYIPEHVKKSIAEAENLLVPSIVKSIGVGKDESAYNITPTLEVNDIVYTYPGGYEAKVAVGEFEYLIFSRRDILFKMK